DLDREPLRIDLGSERAALQEIGRRRMARPRVAAPKPDADEKRSRRRAVKEDHWLLPRDPRRGRFRALRDEVVRVDRVTMDERRQRFERVELRKEGGASVSEDAPLMNS